jgi:NAD(P)-dependent dehydrogenase (short-subunit alcohol dehydrogenase family)
VRTLTKNVALHWATEGCVRVNSVHPGFIGTPILDQAKETPVWEAMTASTPLTASTPMGRLGEPKEIAAAAAYLASDDASFVTRLELYVDGGYMAR